jgi:hypothetical protein
MHCSNEVLLHLLKLWTHRHPFMTQVDNKFQTILAMSDENLKLFQNSFDLSKMYICTLSSWEQETEIVFTFNNNDKLIP